MPGPYTLDVAGTRRPFLAPKGTLGLPYLNQRKTKPKLNKNKAYLKTFTSYINLAKIALESQQVK